MLLGRHDVSGEEGAASECCEGHDGKESPRLISPENWLGSLRLLFWIAESPYRLRILRTNDKVPFYITGALIPHNFFTDPLSTYSGSATTRMRLSNSISNDSRQSLQAYSTSIFPQQLCQPNFYTPEHNSATPSERPYRNSPQTM